MATEPSRTPDSDEPQSAARDVPTLVRELARTTPQHPALVEGYRTRSYAELVRGAERVAGALLRGGLQPGESVALIGTNSIELTEAWLGTLLAGGAVVPLAPSSSAVALVMMLEDAAARWVILDGDLTALFDVGAWAAGGGGRVAVVIGGVAEGAIEWDTWLAGIEPASLPALDAASVFNIIYSSGTTGVPKGIVHSHAFRFGTAVRGRGFGFGPGARTLVSTPLYSNTTMAAFIPTLALGGTAVLMPKFDAGAFLELSERHRITHAMLVPVQYQRLLDHPDFDAFDLSSYELKLSTSAPLRSPLKRAILARWPGRLLEIYGMTEGGVSAILDATAHPDKLHTVGKPPPGTLLLVLGEDDHPVAAGEAGEIVGRGPMMMDGYHRRPEASHEARYTDAAGQRYQRSGDYGRFDADGFLELLDRKKDLIISGGFNVYAVDLETVLESHPDVIEAAVIAIPSERWGESPLGLVVVRAGGPNAETLLAWTNAQLGKVQRLVAVEVRDGLPRSAIGKVLKRELRAAYWAGVER